ncbi:MAG: hypothetical protein U1G07_25210 [Verrucomicrobiota bacterium]
MAPRTWQCLAGTFLMLAASLTAWPCGPWFPNTMLMGGDETLLAAPLTRFQMEIDRIRLPAARFKAASPPPQAGLAQQTFDAEIAELGRALEARRVDDLEQARTVMAFQRVRETLRQHARALEAWRDRQWFRPPGQAPDPPAELETLTVPNGLPAEFADYLAGAIAFYGGDTNAARAHWETLLRRPTAERCHRSTWAAFMLGKVALGDDPEKAAAWFARVRQLAAGGFADSVGLAAASYGWEAKAEVGRHNELAALRLYLLQNQAGDRSAELSLRLVLRRLVRQADFDWSPLAADAAVRQLVTSYIIARQAAEIDEEEEASRLARAWLQAVENSPSPSPDCADRLALAAYQRGWYDLAAAWLDRATASSSLAQWLRAKLLLRAGDINGAAKLMSQVSRWFAREGEWANPPVRAGEEGGEDEWDEESPLRQALGELGVLHLSRREYYQALDTLLRAGYWSDAAYVAEYVLTPDELIAYVERQWPAPEEPAEKASAPGREAGFGSPRGLTSEIRYLVARRLARGQRWQEAWEFYPERWRWPFRQYVEALERGRDAAVAASERAQSLWEAAQLARHQGMELFGTEVEPDWHMFDGQFDWTHVSEARTSGAGRPVVDAAEGGARPERLVVPSLAPSSKDEQGRLARHAPHPNRRFHYRYVAADLAWQAAQLMPNQSDETAHVLWAAGGWLKARDPEGADRFYKALVRRCRRTPLGDAAERLRWFPPTDPPPSPAVEPPSENEVSEEAPAEWPVEGSDQDGSAAP